MTSISTRHIRHDWPEWIDWNNQKTVKTMCGVRSRPGLCGIPAITEQAPVVTKGKYQVWGWCMNCVKETFPFYMPPALTEDVTDLAILELHGRARQELARQYYRYLKSRSKRAAENGYWLIAEGMREEMVLLEKEYPEVTAPLSS